MNKLEMAAAAKNEGDPNLPRKNNGDIEKKISMVYVIATGAANKKSSFNGDCSVILCNVPYLSSLFFFADL